MARAKQRSCFWPWERLAPAEEMGELSERKMFVFSFAAGSAAVREVALLAPSPSVELSGTSSSGTGVLSALGTR